MDFYVKIFIVVTALLFGSYAIGSLIYGLKYRIK